VDPSHVIQSLYGKDSDKLKTAIRISLSEENTAEELQALAEKLNQIIGD
ncbi:cysteine desulfurase, partial [Streptococcus thermophilus]